MLFGGALQESIGPSEVLVVLGIPSDPMGTPGDPLNLERLRYADGLLHDVIGHVQSKWADARRIESLSPSSAPTFDDPGDFD